MSDKNITIELVPDVVQPEPCTLSDGTKFGRVNVHLEITTNNNEKIQNIG